MPKKPIDINKPRGPITAYALFVRTCRDELRRKYPHLTVDYNVIAKKCSDRWKSMNDNEKKRFNDIVDLQRKRYKEELAVYQQEQLIKQQQELQTSSILHQTSSTQYFIEPIQQHTIVNIQKKSIKKRERKPKDPHAPKKPLSAYFLFCADERPKVLSLQTGMSVSDVARELGIRWKQTPAELKIKYEKVATEKRHVYQTELALYKHQSSTNMSSPETPSTPSTSHDNHLTSSTITIQQSSNIQFDNNDINENQITFNTIKNENNV
ncbi:unnamed protein product [Rotaria sp. Silwood1]|nr:unnamed protein product [Rotaria sp. Silwood1]